MLQKNIFAVSVVTGLLLAQGVLSQQCYNQPNCAGDVVSGPTTAEECCIGTDDGMSFGVSGGTCTFSQCVDPFEVGYVKTIYTVIEDEGPVRVCVNLTKPEVDIDTEMVFVESLDFPSSVYIPDDATLAMPDPFNFLTQSYNIIPFSDYERQQLLSNRIRDIGINATRRVICYDQPIYDDLRLEVAEYFGMTLTVQGMPPTTVLTEVRPMYDQVVILNVDNDEAVVGLERTFYNVSEDVGVVEVCAIVYSPTINCPIEFPFDVNLSTSDNTAEHTMDYISISMMLSFAACETRQCVDVTILSDLVDEPVEEFNVTLERTPGLDTRISLQPVDARIIINNDEDPIVVGYEFSVYTTSESRGFVELCAVVSSHPNGTPRAFVISATTADGSATSTMDYTAIVRDDLVFPPGTTRVCHRVQITQDNTCKINPEDFFSNLQYESGVMPIIYHMQTHVLIDDANESECAGDTVTLTSTLTLHPGVTGTPDMERPTVPPTPSVPTTYGQDVPNVIIPDNKTSSNPQRSSDNTVVIIGGAVAAISITTIAIIIVIAIIKLRSHGGTRKAEEHEMDSPTVNSVAITTTPNEAYEEMKGVTITTTPNEAYGQVKGVAITTTPNEAYGQTKGAAITTTPNEAYGQTKGAAITTTPNEAYGQTKGAAITTTPNEAYGQIKGAAITTTPNEAYGQTKGAAITTTPNEAYGQIKGAAITTTPNEAYGQTKGAAITTTPNEAYGQIKGAAITTTPNEAYGQIEGVAKTTTPNEAYGQIEGVAITTTPNEAYGQMQQGGGRQEEETPQYEVVTGHGHPLPAVPSPLNVPTESVDEQSK